MMSWLVSIKKNIIRLLKTRMKTWGKHDYKNLKDLDYQTDEKDRHKTNYTKMWKNKMIKDIASGRIDRDEAINMHVNTIGKEF